MLFIAALTIALIAGCATTHPPVPRKSDLAGDRHAGGARTALLDAARAMLGTPYRYGGNTPSGFDCSGLVQYAHRRIGIAVPRTTDDQWQAARAPARRHLMPGDLLFFDLGSRKDRHVGIYEGSGRFIHAPSSGKQVGRASLDNPYWQSRLIGARSFL